MFVSLCVWVRVCVRAYSVCVLVCACACVRVTGCVRVSKTRQTKAPSAKKITKHVRLCPSRRDDALAQRRDGKEENTSILERGPHLVLRASVGRDCLGEGKVSWCE